MASTTDVTEMFKYSYGSDRLSYIASQEIVLWNIIQRRKERVAGRGQWILPFQTQNTGVFVGHAEGGALTSTRAQPSTTEATFALQEFHGIYDVSWKMLQDAQRSEDAFVRAGEFLEMSMRRRVFRLLNADLLGSGKGELGILPAASDDTTIECRALPLVDQGMIVDVMDLTDDDTKIGDSRTVEAIDVSARTVEISGASLSGTAAGDYITVEDSVSSAGGALHMIGIRAWIDNANPDTVVGNIGGINRSTNGNEFIEANVLDNSGTNRPLSEDLLLQGSDLVRERGGGKITDYITNLPILRRYHEDLRAETIASLGSVQAVDGGLGRNEGAINQSNDGQGQTGMTFSNAMIHAEPFFDANTMIGIVRGDWTLGHGTNEVPQPIGEIFDVPFFKRTANATFEVDHYYQAELLCKNPPSQVKWEDIAES